MRVDEVMTRGVIALRPATSLKDAARVLTEQRITGAPVTDAGRLVGVLSESDIVAKETSGYMDAGMGDEAQHLRRERAAVMHEINRLPVVDHDGNLVGIVTQTDLVRAFIRSDAAVEADIRERLLPSVGLIPQALEVVVEQGVVTITGRVESEVVATCLHATVHLVPGVVEVFWAVDSPIGVE